MPKPTKSRSGVRVASFFPSFINPKTQQLAGAYAIRNYLSDRGFRRLLDGNRRTSDWVVVQLDRSTVREVDGNYVRDLMLHEAKAAGAKASTLDKIVTWTEFSKCESLLPPLSHNGTVPGTDAFATMRDTATEARFAFRNGVVVVTANDVKLHKHDAKFGVLWEHDIIDRNAVVQIPSQRKGLFEQFCEKAFHVRVRTGSPDWRDDFGSTPEQEQHYQAFRSCLGYLLHIYKDRANARAVIFLDADSDDVQAQGGTGKSLTLESCRHLREMVVQDAQKYQTNVRSGGRFQFADVTGDTKLVLLNDATQAFDFKELFNMVTGDMQIERKNENKWSIPFARAPKICISTNYVMPPEGVSYTRRRYVVAFGSYWSECVRHGEQVADAKHLGKRLFDEFTEDDWHDFDNYMFENVSLFLRNGVVEGSLTSIRDRELRQKWGDEFADWATDYFTDYDNRTIDPDTGEVISELMKEFRTAQPTASNPANETGFANGLMDVGRFHGYEFNEHRKAKGSTASQRRDRNVVNGKQVNCVRFTKLPSARSSPAQATTATAQAAPAAVPT